MPSEAENLQDAARVIPRLLGPFLNIKIIFVKGIILAQTVTFTPYAEGDPCVEWVFVLIQHNVVYLFHT